MSLNRETLEALVFPVLTYGVLLKLLGSETTKVRNFNEKNARNISCTLLWRSSFSK